MIFHNLINLPYYERWTRKLKWFYVYFFHFFWPKALAEVIKYSQKFYPTYFSLSTLPVTLLNLLFFWLTSAEIWNHHIMMLNIDILLKKYGRRVNIVLQMFQWSKTLPLINFTSLKGIETVKTSPKHVILRFQIKTNVQFWNPQDIKILGWYPARSVLHHEEKMPL